MKIQERIKILFQNTGKTVSGLAKLLNTRSSTIDGWIKQGKCPSADTIPIIAEYFNVSIDYLLTGEECQCSCKKTKTLLTVREHALIDSFRQLNNEGQDKSLDLVDDIVQSGKYKRGVENNTNSDSKKAIG